MNISSETVGRLWASARGYAQFAVGFSTSLGLISAAQSKTLTDSLAEVWSGVSQVLHGLTSIWQVLVVVGTPIVSVVLAKLASTSAKTSNQAIAVNTAVRENSPMSAATKVSIANSAAELPEVERVVAPTLATNSAAAASVMSK